MDQKAGDSSEQRDAEVQILAVLGARLGLTFAAKSFQIDGVSLNVDGVSEVPFVLCEVCAHHGQLKPGQRRKVIADAFKLIYLEKHQEAGARKIIVMADDEAAAPFRGRSWFAGAFRDFGVEVQIARLDPGGRDKVLSAQQRQVR